MAEKTTSQTSETEDEPTTQLTVTSASGSESEKARRL